MSFNITTTPLGSVSFNGTSQSLTVPSNAAFAYGTGVNFTIEMWIYVSAISGSANMYLFDGRPASTSGLYPTLYVTQTTGTIVYYTNSAVRITSSSAVTINTWYHVALVRNSGTTTLYLNGTATGSTYADTNSYLASAQQIAASYNAGASLTGFYNGYISNPRIVSGVAVYTGTFTPSTQPLSGTQIAGANISAITSPVSTALLLQTPNNTSFISDSSVYAQTITNNGTATASSLTPFSYNVPPFNTSLGSVSLNGTTQYLVTPSSNAAYVLAAGDFTIECWFYWNGTAPSDTNQYTLVSNLASSDNTTWDLQFYNNNWRFVNWSGTAFLQGTSSSFVGNTWNHIAVTRLGGLATLWINGVSNVTNNVATSLTTQNVIRVGYNGFNQFWKGYISNVRVVKGIAVYTSTFTPSTSLLTATQKNNVNGSPSAGITSTQTSLLLNTPNTSAFNLDTSSLGVTMTVNGSATSNDATPFTNTQPAAYFSSTADQYGSIKFNGTNQYVSIPASSALAFGTGAFTAEAWVYPLAYGNSLVIDFFSSLTPYTVGYWQLYYDGTGAVTFGYASTTTVFSSFSTTTKISLNTWTHLAVVRNGTTVTIYINGVSSATATISQVLGVSTAGAVGYQLSNGTQFLNGYISNVRIVNGVAVYTGAFTPPTQPLTGTQAAGRNISAITGVQTSLLLQTPNNTNFINDNSFYGLATTAGGTPIASSLTPF